MASEHQTPPKNKQNVSLKCRLLFQHVDFETKRSYTLKVEATNPHVDPRFISWGPYKDTTVVKISVEDADEPPAFMTPGYSFEVEENAPGGTVVGRVHAKDTDIANSPIR